MKFEKLNLSCKEIETTNKHEIAAKRALKKEEKKAGLFKELMKFSTVKERLENKRTNMMRFVFKMRNYEARTWRKARRELKTIPLQTQKKLMNEWNNIYSTIGGKMDATRFASLVSKVKRDPCIYERKKFFENLHKDDWVKTLKISSFINSNINILSNFIKRLEKRYKVNVLRYTCSHDCLHVVVCSQDEKNALMEEREFIAKQIIYYLHDIGYKISNEIFFFNAYSDNRVPINQYHKHFYKPIKKFQPNLAI